MLKRYSSRRRRLDAGFLNARLAGARSYDRIAGYFSASILEVAGEALESVRGPVRVVCNSALAPEDVEAAKAAQQAMRREWCASRPERLGAAAKPRCKRLYEWLRSGAVEIRVLPDDAFGLIHGKAGVVTLADGRRISFLGSANETGAAFRLNYELIWEDDSPDSVEWVQEEFDALWSSPSAVRLADFVIRDLERHNPYLRGIVRRTREYLETTIDAETGEPYLTPVRVRLHGDAAADAVALPPFLADAYEHAEEFCRLLAARAAAGFVRTMLLRRIGSTIEAGRLTASRLLAGWPARAADRDDDEDDEDGAAGADRLRALTGEERGALLRLTQALEANRELDPKLAAVRRLLVDDGWLERGCIVFSQYYDSVRWLAGRLARELPDEAIGIYAGADRSGVMRGGRFDRAPRDELKDAVRRGEVRLLLGTEAASEGLNLQRLGSLINLDLPWNPSRLEQRKGRIQRIGQVRSEVDVYNLRYAGSVEDRVHELLSERLEWISRLFGQLPDTLEDVWVQVALGQAEQARRTIDAVPRQHPFELRYREVSPVDWESCARVLDDAARTRTLARGWQEREAER